MSERIYTVTELTRSIRACLEDEFLHVWVQGEVSSLARPSSGHLYFNVKDSRSQIAAVMFKTASAKLKFELEEGVEALFSGRIGVYEPRGSYQLIVEKVEPIGEGALQLALAQLKDKLEARGWFNPELKKPLPFLPQRIGVVTSPTGAALQDILNILRRRFASIPVVVAPARVQGEGAKEEIARQIAVLDAMPGVEVILVARGGGSLEDLWAFNSEEVAEAIFRAKTPIVSAVGHETDFTLADFVADLRAPTPSAAAELVVPVREELWAKVQSLEGRLQRQMRQQLASVRKSWQQAARRFQTPNLPLQAKAQELDEVELRLQHAMQRLLQRSRQRLLTLEARFKHDSPKHQLQRSQAKLELLEERLRHGMQLALAKKERNLAVACGHLESLSPLGVIARGYGLARSPAGQVLGSVKEFKLNQEFRLLLQDGEVISQVNEIKPKE